MYEKSKTPIRPLIAYKGGFIEKNLLQELGILYLYLEYYSSPKLNDMTRLHSVISCGHHDNPIVHHCHRVKCFHFVQWLQKHLSLPFDMDYVTMASVKRLGFI